MSFRMTHENDEVDPIISCLESGAHDDKIDEILPLYITIFDLICSNTGATWNITRVGSSTAAGIKQVD